MQDAIVIVEWPERSKEIMDADHLDVSLNYASEIGPDARIVTSRRSRRLREASRILQVAARVPAPGGLGRRASRLPARRRLIEILRDADEARRRARHTDDLAGSAGRAAHPLRAGPTARSRGSPRISGPSSRSPKVSRRRACPRRRSSRATSTPASPSSKISDAKASSTQTVPFLNAMSRRVEALALLHSRKLSSTLPLSEGGTYRIPPYDIDALLIEVELLLDWYVDRVARIIVPSGARAVFIKLWRAVLAECCAADPDLDAARLPLPEPPLASRARRGAAAGHHRFSGLRHGAPGL